MLRAHPALAEALDRRGITRHVAGAATTCGPTVPCVSILQPDHRSGADLLPRVSVGPRPQRSADAGGSTDRLRDPRGWLRTNSKREKDMIAETDPRLRSRERHSSATMSAARDSCVWSAPSCPNSTRGACTHRGRASARAVAAARLLPWRRHRFPGRQCHHDRGGDLARPAGTDGGIQVESVVAGDRRTPDLPCARDQARASGRCRRGRRVLRQRRCREAHRDRAGFDRDAAGAKRRAAKRIQSPA